MYTVIALQIANSLNIRQCKQKLALPILFSDSDELFLAIGKTDFLYPANQNFIQKLTDLELSYTYFETEGGHTWSNWRHYLSEFVTLLFLNKTL